MKPYQIKALHDLETIQNGAILRKATNASQIDLTFVIEVVQRLIDVIKGNAKEEEKLIDYYSYLEILFRYLHLTEYEKMHLFFDCLEENARLLREYPDNPIFLDDFMIELEKLQIDVEDLQTIMKTFKNKEERNLEIKRRYPKVKNSFFKDLDENIAENLKKKAAYQSLYENYFKNFRRPTEEEYEEIKKALIDLKITPFFQIKVLKELRKDIKKRKEEVYSKPISSKPLNIESIRSLHDEYKSGLSLKEWKRITEKVQIYYDLDSKLPIRSLDIKERIELAKLLQQLEYSDEEIKWILWRIDEMYPLNGISNDKENSMRNALIMKKLIEKTKDNPRTLSENIKFINDELTTSKEDEKEIWRDLLIDSIEEENVKIKHELVIRQEELKKMPCGHKDTWRKIFLEEANYSSNSAFLILKIILRELKFAPKEEKTKWKKCFIETLERIELEERGNYTYELEQASKIRKKNKVEQ